MIEGRKNKSLDKSPVRIRPPDEKEDQADSTEWSEALSVPTEKSLPRWLSVDQVRKMQRMRRETVVEAMRSGELPFERRGRVCYIRLTDVLGWEERRMESGAKPVRCSIHPDLAGLA